MRIALFGQAAFGRDALAALQAAGEQVVGVSTPRPGARPDALAEAALQAGLPNVVTRDLRAPHGVARLRSWRPDLLVFAFVTDIVRPEALAVAPRGAIQYHPSLLPLHRGRSAMAWPLIAGEATTGVTIFWVDEGIDTGPILLQREVAIGEQDSVGSLYFNRLYPLGIELLVDAVRQVREGTAPRIPQDHARATYEPPIGDEHAAIDWQRPGRTLFNHVRGCDPQPGARATLDGAPVRLFDTAFRPGPSVDGRASPTGPPPGTVLAERESAIEVAVIGGSLRVGRLQREGEAKAPAAAVAAVGSRFGPGALA